MRYDVCIVFSVSGIVIGLQVVRGELDTVRQERPMLFAKGVSICRKLGFGDIIMPGKKESTLKEFGFSSLFCHIAVKS